MKMINKIGLGILIITANALSIRGSGCIQMKF